MADIGNEQRIAVGRGFSDECGADASTCTGTILDDYVLRQRVAELLPDESTDRIGAAARRGGYHELDRSLRVALRGRIITQRRGQ